MRNKIKYIILAGGVMSVSLASFVSLTSYAAEASSSSQTELTAIVNKSLSLDSASGFDVTGDPGKVLNGKIQTKVTSNAIYTISIRTKTNVTDMVSQEVSNVIPASENVVENNSAWGIKKKNGLGDNDNEATYTKITPQDQPLFTSGGKSANNGDDINFTVGISTTPTTLASSYSVDLIVTVANV